ncbi:transcriptional regulator, MarR family [Streptomyces sp. DvalAA-14]|uniref:MarR family winged helix-turn-helix transcriptional regulator n=1 Tax=unclassified Streptomyces TaxID=2593676 RepID=UPI00081B6E49|nr:MULTISPECIES: MarR family transcriptional regulator [unclassified Streptomyces]MYS20192.1 MarR family transcriptional regulator [Streptomyces sp. SID4948]SCD63004.1 transcriptional regulator, MarR family [Streptomyces sp. DvalAA-14]
MSDVRDVRWLTGPEQEIWRAYLSASVEFAAHIDRQLRRDSGMPMAYYEILVRLSEAPERCLRMSELADASLSSRSRLSHAVSALEKNGWVERRPADADRRGWVCGLTDAGFDALAAAAPGHVSTVREKLFDVLTPAQLDTLRDIGHAISAGLKADCAEARAEDEQSCPDAAGGADGAGQGPC